MTRSGEKNNMVHATVVYRSCDESKLNDADSLRSLLREAAAVTKLNVLDERFHEFEPVGFTGILLLSESHIAIHTWPEDRLAVLNFFSCGIESPDKAIKLVQKGLQAKEAEIHLVPIKN
jgi:S-adenosylmethionine decarboxylase proenzyme